MSAAKMAELHALVSASPWSEASFAQQLSQPDTILFEHAKAFALGRAILDEAELLQIATHPEHQRRGIGREVLTGFEQCARTRGCRRLFLEGATSNLAAISLYQSAGWQQDGRRKGYYRHANGQREDALLMSKNL